MVFLILKIFELGVVGVVAVAGVGVVLVFMGSLEPCVDRQVSISSEPNRALKDKWRAFAVESLSAPALVTFTESEGTSRGVEYVLEGRYRAGEPPGLFLPGGPRVGERNCRRRWREPRHPFKWHA